MDIAVVVEVACRELEKLRFARFGRSVRSDDAGNQQTHTRLPVCRNRCVEVREATDERARASCKMQAYALRK